MAGAGTTQLRQRAQAAWDNLTRQLAGMDAYMERSDAPGEWTTREVLCHLLGEPGWDHVAFLKTFALTDLPVLDLDPGNNHATPERQALPLSHFRDALTTQFSSVFEYVESLSEADLQRKARIPLFKTFMGTDEVSIPVYVGAMFDYHWNDHAAQLAKIRKAVGLPVAT
jgi:DinB family protein